FTSGVSSLGLDACFRTAKRVALDEYSWVEVVPNWLSGAHVLLSQMTVSVPWLQHERRMFDKVLREPRLTAQYHDVRDVPEPMLFEAARALSSLRCYIRQLVAEPLPRRTGQHRLAS